MPEHRVLNATVKIQARRKAARLGHELGKFEEIYRYPGGRKTLLAMVASCKVCGADVNVQRPETGDIIIGPAVTDSCKDRIAWQKEIVKVFPVFAEKLFCLRINGYRWFQRTDFLAWLSTYQDKGRRPIATWFNGDLDSSSDIFMTYDNQEGSDFENMPADIWEEICGMVEREKAGSFGVIWITNLLPGDQYPDRDHE